MTFMMQHFSWAPHMREALAAWRSTDASIAELRTIADELSELYRVGGPTTAEIAAKRARIRALNAYMAPRTNLFRSEEHTSGTPVTNAHLVCRLLLEKKT